MLTNLNINQISDTLKSLWVESMCPPVLLIGPPGGGKTSIVGQVAKDLGLPYEVLMGNSLEPSDVMGIPHLKDGEMVFAPPAWALRIAGKRAVLNFDELNTARPATLAALLRVILERKVGDIDLGPNVMVVATMNPTDESAHGWELPPAVANRFLHFCVDPTSVSDWQKWALALPDHLPEFQELVRTFPLPSLYSAPCSGPFGSPRSWYFALRAAARMMSQGPSYEAAVQTVIAAAVSPGLAIEWNAARSTPTSRVWEQMAPDQVGHVVEKEIMAAQAGQLHIDDVWSTVASIGSTHDYVLHKIFGKHKKFIMANTTPQGEKLLQELHKRLTQDAAKPAAQYPAGGRQKP